MLFVFDFYNDINYGNDDDDDFNWFRFGLIYGGNLFDMKLN